MKAARLSSVVRRYFDAWMAQEPWDDSRSDASFYLFVKSVVRYSRPAPTGAGICALILEEWIRRGVYDDEDLRAQVNALGMLYETLLDYEKACCSFPNRIAEGNARKDIVTYWLAVCVCAQSNQPYIEQKMREEYGEGWQTELDKAKGEY